MATKFSISDSESEEEESNQTSEEEEQQRRLNLSFPDPRLAACRIRLNSESITSTLSRDEEIRGEEEAGTPTDGAPFRGRSKSAPPSLWAAKKYGQRLRRMSDEFDSLLDKGEMKKLRNPDSAKQIHHSRSWWSYLFSHQESEGENNHHENHSHDRTE